MSLRNPVVSPHQGTARQTNTDSLLMVYFFFLVQTVSNSSGSTADNFRYTDRCLDTTNCSVLFAFRTGLAGSRVRSCFVSTERNAGVGLKLSLPQVCTSHSKPE